MPLPWMRGAAKHRGPDVTPTQPREEEATQQPPLVMEIRMATEMQAEEAVDAEETAMAEATEEAVATKMAMAEEAAATPASLLKSGMG